MKLKNYLLWGLALIVLVSLDSCKSKESAYKAAYEAAKAREMQENQVDEVTPVSKPADVSNETVQKEKVTVIGGTIRQFSVVIGSFQNKTNAEGLKDRMINQGFQAFLAQNERGWYRVIVATYNDKASAVTERNRVKSKYYPDFQDAWILDNQ